MFARLFQSDLDLAVRSSKRLEALLAHRYGARGRGLHELVSSVEARLDPGVVRQLRFVATIRNKLVHDADYQRMDDRAAFKQACRAAERSLRRRGGWRWIVGAVAVVLAGAAAWWVWGR